MEDHTKFCLILRVIHSVSTVTYMRLWPSYSHSYMYAKLQRWLSINTRLPARTWCKSCSILEGRGSCRWSLRSNSVLASSFCINYNQSQWASYHLRCARACVQYLPSHCFMSLADHFQPPLFKLVKKSKPKSVYELQHNYYHKVTFLCEWKKSCEFVKTGLSINLCDFYLCILAFYIMYGAKNYGVQIITCIICNWRLDSHE